MPLERTTPIFFDASCLIAAAGSPNGGSGFLLSLCARGYLQAAVSTYVLAEAARNIQAKMKADVWVNYQALLQVVPFMVAPVPEPLPDLPPINSKDIHVVAAALAAAATHLLTLDQGLVTEANLAEITILTLTPGDFIKTVLPTHVLYPRFP